MNRTTRSVGLTEAGEFLLARVGPAMSDVGDALEQVRGLRGVPSGRLRINAPPPVIDLVLAPMAAPFLQAYPRIDFRDRRGQFLRRYRRHRLRCGSALWRASRARYDRGLVGTAATVCCRGIAAIHCAAWPAKAPKGPAETFRDQDPVRQRPRAELGIREGRSSRESVAAGQADREPSGAGAARDSRRSWFLADVRGYVREDIRSGALVSVLDDWCTPFPGPFLYYPSRRQTPPALGAFIAFVAEWRKREL